MQWVDYHTEEAFPPTPQAPRENPVEAGLIVDLLRKEHARLQREGATAVKDVAIITPYRPPRRLVLERTRGVSLPHFRIQVDTGGSFQGKDADYVIFSVVRPVETHRFFADPRRLNVALSRVLGNTWGPPPRAGPSSLTQYFQRVHRSAIW